MTATEGEDTHLTGSLGHGDGGTHTHGRVDGTHIEAQSVAADITEHLAAFVLGHNLVQSGVAINVRAALAERRRTVSDHLWHLIHHRHIHAEGLGDLLGIQLAITADGLIETTHNVLTLTEEALDMLLNKWLTVFEDEDFVALIVQLVDHIVRQWILRHLDNRIRALAIREVLHEVIVSNTRGDDTDVLLRAINVFVEARGL